MRNRYPADPRREVTKRAALSIVWGIIAGIAYLGLIGRSVTFITNLTGSSPTIDSGLISLTKTTGGSLNVPASLQSFLTTLQPFLYVAVAAVPIAIIATIVLGILLRARPRTSAFAGLLIVAALLGLIGSLIYFLRVVATVSNGKEAVIALITGVVVSILLRLQRSIRQSYQKNPALVTLIVAFLTVIYLVLANGTSITSIFLSDIDVWLALVAFAIVLYAGIRMLRFQRVIPRGK